MSTHLFAAGGVVRKQPTGECAYDPRTHGDPGAKRIANPDLVAVSFTGDGAAALRALADDYDRRVSSQVSEAYWNAAMVTSAPAYQPPKADDPLPTTAPVSKARLAYQYAPNADLV
jgi:hypothetical protein